MTIGYYSTRSGRRPVKEFLDSLGEKDRALCVEDLEALKSCKTLEEIRQTLVVTRNIQGKLWEIKTGKGRKQRIFYVLIAPLTMVLLHACRKAKRQAEKKNLDLAKKRLKEVLSE